MTQRTREPSLKAIDKLNMDQTSSDYGIRWMPGRTYGGWHAKIIRMGQTYEKYFSSLTFGGVEPARLVAQAWLEGMALKTPAMTKAQFCAIPRSNNTSGFPGVIRRKVRRKLKSGQFSEHDIYVARSPKGQRPVKDRSFSVARHGEAEAFRLAVDARQTFLAEIEGLWLNAAPQWLHPIDTQPTDSVTVDCNFPTRAAEKA